MDVDGDRIVIRFPYLEKNTELRRWVKEWEKKGGQRHNQIITDIDLISSIHRSSYLELADCR